MLRFSLTVKQGLETLAQLEGHERQDSAVTFADLDKVIEVEQYLERLMGLRFHISIHSSKPQPDATPENTPYAGE